MNTSMKVMCKKSMHPVRIHNNAVRWVYCPTLMRKKIQKTSVDICKECRFFNGIEDTLPGAVMQMNDGSTTNYVRNSSIGIRPGFKRREVAVSVEELGYEQKDIKDTVPLVNVFDEGDKVRILAQIPLCYVQKEITLEYENMELVIQAGNYKQRVKIEDNLAVELKGDVKLCSLKSGIVSVELI